MSTDAQQTRKNEMMAERVGFEPTVEFPLHTLSKRAHSTALTSLRMNGFNRLQGLARVRQSRL